MEIWKLSALMVTVLVYSVQSFSFTLNREDWISDNWGDEPVQEKLAGLLKRSKSHQFYGLMGKRSEILQPVRIMDRRRHKGDMFVGLMGRRSAGPVTKTIAESSTTTDNCADLNKQADLQDVWNRLQHY